jgi:hypothetical protein
VVGSIRVVSAPVSARIPIWLVEAANTTSAEQHRCLVPFAATSPSTQWTRYKAG